MVILKEFYEKVNFEKKNQISYHARINQRVKQLVTGYIDIVDQDVNLLYVASHQGLYYLPR